MGTTPKNGAYNMIYIKYNEQDRVTLQHFQPLDPVNGLGLSEEELKLSGIFVESIPAPLEPAIGKTAILYANPLRWEYEDRSLTQKEKLQNMVDAGIITQAQMDDLLK